MYEEFFAALRFIPYAAAAGAAVSMLDYLTSHVSGKSVLGLRYGGADTAKWLLLWTVGAALAGFVGLLAQILQATVPAAMTVAITWPFLLRQISQERQKNEEVQPDVGDVADEKEA